MKYPYTYTKVYPVKLTDGGWWYQGLDLDIIWLAKQFGPHRDEYTRIDARYGWSSRVAYNSLLRLYYFKNEEDYTLFVLARCT